MILLSIIAFLASFPTAKAEGIAVQQDTIKKVRRLDIKKFEENSVPLQLKIEKEEDKTMPVKNRPASRKKRGTISGQEIEYGDSIAAGEEAKPSSMVPTYPGGYLAMRDYIKKNTRYPAECKSERLVGKAIVKVTIMPDGTPTDASIHKSSGNPHMDAEALRVVCQMPKWTPADSTRKVQETTTHIPVNFRPGR